LKKVTKIGQNTADVTEKSKLRVAAYCRVSTDSDKQLESLDTQIKHYKPTLKQILSGSSPDFIMTRASPAQKRKSGLNCFE